MRRRANWRGGPKLALLVVVVALGGGTFAAVSCTCGPHRLAGPAEPGPASSQPRANAAGAGNGTSTPVANIAVSTTGDDSACARVWVPVPPGSIVPCGTMDQALSLARCGDTIGLEGGSYDAQTLDDGGNLAGCAGDPVTFEPFTGSTVNVATLSAGDYDGAGNAPQNVTIENIGESQTWQSGPCGWALFDGGSHITLDHISACDVFITGETDPSLTWSVLGNCTRTISYPNCGDTRIAQDHETTGAVFGNDVFERVRAPNPNTGDAVHTQCLALFGGAGTVIENSTFSGCDFFDIFIQPLGPATLGSVTIGPGNTFNPPSDGPPPYGTDAPTIRAIDADQPFTGLSITGNTFVNSGFELEDNPSPTGFLVADNTFGIDPSASGYCYASLGVTYTGNDWSANRC